MLAATLRAEDAHFWFLGLRRVARQLIDEARGAAAFTRIVDCGAGTGRNLDWLGALGPAIGVERSWFGLHAGRSRGRTMVGGSVDALPLADTCADLATSFDVLYCLDDRTERRALQEMWRILRPGGLALFNVAALDILRGSHSTLTHEVRRYTRARLSERLVAAGFRVERITFTNCTLFPPALVRRGLERLTGQAGSASESDLSVPPPLVNGLFDRALAFEARVLRVVNLPIGTSIMAVARKP